MRDLSSDQCPRLLDVFPDPVAYVTSEGMTHSNRSWKTLAQYLTGDEASSPSRLFSVCTCLRPAAPAREALLLVPDGRVFEHRVFHSEAQDRGCAGVSHWLRDITDSWRMGEERHHLEQLYRTLSQCNQALVRAEDEKLLAQALCDNLVTYGGIHAAWVFLLRGDGQEVLEAQAPGPGKDAITDGLLARIQAGTRDSGGVRCAQVSLPPTEAEASTALTVELYPLAAGPRLLGYLGVAAEPIGFSRQAEFGLLRELAGDLDFGIRSLRAGQEKARLEVQVAGQSARERQVLEATIAALAALVEKRDAYTAGHQRRVGRLCVLIGRRLGLPDELLEGLALAGTVHDIGKIAVPVEILSKPTLLSSAEFEIIRQHPVIGAEILSGIDFPWPIADYIRAHHEKLDGSGYPDGRTGDSLSLPVRVLTVADVVEAMMSHRPYRPALGIDAALVHIAEGRGRLYDAAVVDACTAVCRAEGFSLD